MSIFYKMLCIQSRNTPLGILDKLLIRRFNGGACCCAVGARYTNMALGLTREDLPKLKVRADFRVHSWQHQ